MRASCVLIRLALMGFLLAPASPPRLTAQSQTPPYAAIVTDLSGTILVRKAGRTDFAPAVWGTQLYRGDQIKTRENSQASILFMNNNLIVLESGSTLTIQENNAAGSAKGLRAVSSDLAVNLAGLTLRESRDGEAGALSGLRASETATGITPRSPRGSKIRSIHPAFFWESNQKFDTYKVTVLTDEGTYWTRQSPANALEYPQDAPRLKEGSAYFWHVTGEGLFEQTTSTTVRFTVLSSGEIEAVQKEEQHIKQTLGKGADNSSLHFLLGAYYDRMGLWDEAIVEFEKIAARNADAPLPHEILGRLYEKVDLKDRAIQELQKAVYLSQERQ